MDPVFIKLMALLAVVLLVCKRAIFGPQVQFARASVAMSVAGVGFLLLAIEKGDFSATVGAVFMLLGLSLALAMMCVDCVHMIRANIGKKSG